MRSKEVLEAMSQQVLERRAKEKEGRALLGRRPRNGRNFRVELPKEALKPRECRKWLRETLAANYPELVRRFLEDGSPRYCAQMKMVIELLEGSKRVKAQKGVVERLWEEFEEKQGAESRAEATAAGS